MIIALTVLNINLKLGVFMIFLSVLTSISRIMVGVHYPSDILAAWIIAITLNFVGVKF
jgi:undecaprenyl-diphosphatase